MTSVALRKSLLALAIAATLPSLAAAAPADFTCANGVSCELTNTTYNQVTVPTGTATGGTIGLNLNNSTITTLNNSGTISGSIAGLQSQYSTITTLNNSGTISGISGVDPMEIFSLTSPMTINNSGDILGSSNGYAINAQSAHNAITLNWTAGLIRGTMRGVQTINIDGDVVYDARYSYGNISLANNARLTLEQDSINMAGGNLTLANNAKLDIYLSSVTPLASGTGDGNAVVTSISTATFGAGSQIGLKLRGADFSAEKSTYTLLSGEGIVDNGLSVVARDSALLRVDSFSVNAGKVLATVSTVDEYKFSGNTPNAQRAGSAILPLLSSMSSSNPNNPVLNALAGDADEVARTVEQLTPQVNGGALQAANTLSNQADLNAGERTQGLRGASAGDAFVERGLWMKALNSSATQNKRDGIEGFDADSNGIAIGADGKFNDQLTLGIAYSYLNSDIDSDGGNKTEIDGHAITLYSGYEQDAWFLDSSLTLGLNHNDSKRYIAGTTAKADYDSQMFGLNVLGGYGFKLDNGVVLEPRAAARYGRVDIDSYSEKGSIAALRIEDQRYEVAELGAGLRLAGSLPLGQGTLQPEAKVMVYHDFAADQVANTASFTFGGSPFVANGASLARTRYEAGVGVDYKLAAVTLGLSYDYTGKEDFSADTFQAKVRYDF
ncbi:MAG: autotransporter outer membrane beta-barrel domain-containing protein [Gammaproteobacteria bacterium]|nr:autotransporter outer membrane beta-barrel domain-containing protein [Gammaproteobacteria bacterium]MBU0884201.1 autotransporter outer membrane beta-barrel domain-containing protein [Gammaproteobacteria bacterium]MBU1860434.1 autotransporter outer membrane beta-barrel domain-containing protein [Gammaproteobacteria bacterium]